MMAEVAAQLPMDRVHFLGSLPHKDYLRVLAVSSCHVYLTYPFVLSWSCVEAMSAGCVIVASNTGPLEEVIEDGINGLLVDFFDTASLSQQVIEVLRDPEKYKGVGIRARKTVIDRFDLRKICLPRQVALLSEPVIASGCL